MQITIELQGINELESKLRNMQASLNGDVIQSSINKVAQSVRDEIGKSVTSAYNLGNKEVDDSMRLRKAGGNEMVATVSIWGSPSRRGRAMNLIRFLQTQSTAGTLRRSGMFGTSTRREERMRDAHALEMAKRQLEFLIKRGASLKQIKGAFIGNKGRTVFRRLGKDRYPIEGVSTIGVGQMFNSRAIRDRILSMAQAELQNEIQRKLDAAAKG